MPKTTFQKIWEAHEVRPPETEGGASLIYVDLHLVHEVTSAQAFESLRLAGRKADVSARRHRACRQKGQGGLPESYGAVRLTGPPAARRARSAFHEDQPAYSEESNQPGPRVNRSVRSSSGPPSRINR